MSHRYLLLGLSTILSAGCVLAQGGGLPWLSPVYPLYTQPLIFGKNATPIQSVPPDESSPGGS